ncbi:DinB family protein [Ferruginibacter sp.]
MQTINKRDFFIEFGDKDHAIAYFSGIIKDTRTTTLLTIKNLTTQELDWQYQQGWNTIGALLLHIAAVEQYFCIRYVDNRELTEQENTELTPALDMGIHIPSLITGKGINHYIDALLASRQKLLVAFENINFEHFATTFESKDYGGECNVAWLLYHMMEDENLSQGADQYDKEIIPFQKCALNIFCSRLGFGQRRIHRNLQFTVLKTIKR